MLLRGVLGQFGQSFAVSLGGGDDLHFLPVIRKFLAAIKTCDIGSGQCSGLWTALCAANGYGEAVARVPAAKKRFNQFFDHDPTFHAWACSQYLGL